MITFKKKPKEKTGPRKVRRHKRKMFRDNTPIIASIFKEGELDLSYVTNDKDLLARHIDYINSCYRIHRKDKFSYSDCVVPSGRSAGLRPKPFVGFKENYVYIYERWVHLIKCCLRPRHPLYPYFGGRGVYMSREFLDGKKFCIWCLKNGLTSKLGTYGIYLQRKRKDQNYSPKNCFVIKESDVHTAKTLRIALDSIAFLKQYEEKHDDTVSYMTAYTRYYNYDFNAYDASNYKLDTSSKRARAKTLGFSPTNFYRAVATEKDCTMSVFLSRYHYSYLNGGFIARPYDMLNPSYSVSAEAEKQGKVSYKRQWERNRKQKEKKDNAYNNYESFFTNSLMEVYKDIK